jgi:tetratricopeptide (TPR) repeat protein
VLGLALLGLNRFDEAREHFLAMAASGEPPGNAPPHRAIFLNNLAWANLMAGGDDRLGEADRYSQQAMRLTPWVAAIKGTRGSVLVALGQTGEGLSLLEEAIVENDENADKALNACFLAIGYQKEGNETASRKFLDKVRTLDPQCELMPWVEEQIASSRSLNQAEV